MSDVRELGVEGLISPYSYISHDGQFAYLEHTGDAAEFARHFRRRFGRYFAQRRFDTVEYSFIRFLPGFPSVSERRPYEEVCVASSEEEARTLAKLLSSAHGENDSRSRGEEGD